MTTVRIPSATTALSSSLDDVSGGIARRNKYSHRFETPLGQCCCVSQSSHNSTLTSRTTTRRFKPSLCEPILTQRTPDQLNQLIPTNGTVTMRVNPHKPALPAAESGDTSLLTRLCVSQSSHNGGLASPTGRFQPLHRSSCESILAQRHRPARRSPQRVLTCLCPPLQRTAARRLRRWRRGCRRFRGTRPRGIAVRG